jgi:hypothetical protein
MAAPPFDTTKTASPARCPFPIARAAWFQLDHQPCERAKNEL